MLPILRKVALSPTQSVSAFVEKPPAFETPWHYHPEYELILIENCTGTRYMGDSISEFGTTELVLIGPNLPHFWKEGGKYDHRSEHRAFVVHFDKKIIDHILLLPESVLLSKMLIDSLQGLSFLEPLPELISMVKSLINKKSLDRYLSLLNMLNKLTHTAYKKLSSRGFVNIYNSDDVSRMDKVMKFTVGNFRKKIAVEEVAALVSINKTSFCRYFKQRTGKNYYHLIRELRIGNACRLLQKETLDISTICYESGYDNLSNFNKQFKVVTKMTPREYRYSFNKNNRDI